MKILWKEILQIKLDIWGIFFGRGDKNEKLVNGLKLSLLLWIIFLQSSFKFMYEWKFWIILLKKTLWPLFMDGVQLLKATEPLWGDSLLFTTRSLGVPGTDLISLGRMTSEQPSDFEPRTTELGVQRHNR